MKRFPGCFVDDTRYVLVGVDDLRDPHTQIVQMRYGEAPLPPRRGSFRRVGHADDILQILRLD